MRLSDKIFANILFSLGVASYQVSKMLPILPAVGARIFSLWKENKTLISQFKFFQLPPNVYEFVRPEPNVEPLVDVVFVHGFRGSVFKYAHLEDASVRGYNLRLFV